MILISRGFALHASVSSLIARRCAFHSLNTVHTSQRGSLGDRLIHVDENDKVLGYISKLDGHLADSIKKRITHRAFSVFMFSRTDSSLLIQKRADTKIVFPRQWANTCCSHPLYVPDEMDSNRNMGIKRAASKRMDAELSISDLAADNFSFKDKIVYRQLSPSGVYGESEVDYILFSLLDKPINPPFNPDEVEETYWVPPGPSDDRTQFLREFIASQTRQGFPATPWFSLMMNDPDCLPKWWSEIMANADEFLSSEFDPNKNKIRSFLH